MKLKGTIKQGKQLKAIVDEINIASTAEYIAIHGKGLISEADKVKLDAIHSGVPADAKFTDTVYDDTEIQKKVAKNTNAIDVLNGSETMDGSVKKAVADVIAKIVAGAPDSLDTLKEISDWIASHAESASEMNSKIQDNSNEIAVTKSSIPTMVSQLTNDSGYLTTHQDISGKADKSSLATVATSGSYKDLKNTPTIQKGATVYTGTTDTGYESSGWSNGDIYIKIE